MVQNFKKTLNVFHEMYAYIFSLFVYCKEVFYYVDIIKIMTCFIFCFTNRFNDCEFRSNMSSRFFYDSEISDYYEILKTCSLTITSIYKINYFLMLSAFSLCENMLIR